MEEVQYSSNAESDAFDWNMPYDPPPSSPAPATAPAPPVDVAESSRAQKQKALAARIIREDCSPAPPTAANPLAQNSPTKRRRHLHIITSDSDDNDSNDQPSSKSLAL
ncbi:hypothetical protein V6N13_023137 [Hibiscus sabdariffa]